MADDKSPVIPLNVLRVELQSSGEAVLSDIKSEIASLFQVIIKDISSPREETKADIWSVRSELANKLASLYAAYREFSHAHLEMGKSLNDTMDRVAA
ncbi:hypothetical protein ABVT39_009333 [Epinephelus coioides]